MKNINKALLLVAGLIACTVIAAPTPSSAAVVCNRDGDCWRVRGRPAYGPDLGLRIYADNWRWKRGENYRWRKAQRGHGYYRDGTWVVIRP